MDTRLTDLEAEVAKLKEQVKLLRGFVLKNYESNLTMVKVFGEDPEYVLHIAELKAVLDQTA